MSDGQVFQENLQFNKIIKQTISKLAIIENKNVRLRTKNTKKNRTHSKPEFQKSEQN